MLSLSRITVTEISALFSVFSPKGRVETIRNRACYGISFCTEGKITYTLDGKQTVSDEQHAVLLPKGKSYTLHGDKTGRFPVINFDCLEPLCEEIFSVPIPHVTTYVRAYESMKALSLFPENRAEIMSIFYGILHRLSIESTVHSRLAPAVRRMEADFPNPLLTNTELAKSCHVSEVYFRKLFSEAYGTTPKQYLIGIRLHHAKQLLAEGGLTVGAVAEQCGFTNPYHFCRVFQEKTGMTPTAYGKAHRRYQI